MVPIDLLSSKIVVGQGLQSKGRIVSSTSMVYIASSRQVRATLKSNCKGSDFSRKKLEIFQYSCTNTRGFGKHSLNSIQ